MKHTTALPAILLAGLAASGCSLLPFGKKEKKVEPAPELSFAAPETPPPQTKLYTDCIAASIAAGTYDKEAKENLLRLTCEGAPAQAFYDGIGMWSLKIGSRMIEDGAQWRFTTKMKRNPVGLDGCAKEADGRHHCVINLNIGEFFAYPWTAPRPQSDQ